MFSIDSHISELVSDFKILKSHSVPVKEIDSIPTYPNPTPEYSQILIRKVDNFGTTSGFIFRSPDKLLGFC